MDKLGLYVHFPFCLRKCYYCDFPSYAGREKLMNQYISSLNREISNIKYLGKGREVDTIFFGGGTPTLFSGKILGTMLRNLGESFNISKDAEISIESNPETLDRDKLAHLRDSGFNRLSIGMQECKEKHLKALGRGHSIEDVKTSFNLAREVGFYNINLDLMFGIPDQTLKDWLDSLNMALGMGADHISAYALIIEEGTPFYNFIEEGKLNLPSDELERDMYHKGIKYLKEMGYIQYEISNFTKKGMECRHNLKYWQNHDYIGVGSGAHSSIDGTRWANFKSVDRYIDSIGHKGYGIEEKQKTPIETQRFETIMMGLRLTKGLYKAQFLKRFGKGIHHYYGEAIRTLKAQGLLLEDDGYIYLSQKGMDLQNQVLMYFLD